MNYYEKIKNKLIDNEIYERVKDYSKERHRVITYYDIGKILNEAGSKYGDKIIERYSEKLVLEVNKKYNKRTLFRMKQFYNKFNNEKVSTLSTLLTWSHYTELLPIEDNKKMLYYLNISINKKLDVRTLREKIKNSEYERLSESSINKIISNKEINMKELIPNPILIKNKNDVDIVNEKVLHRIILEDISGFMKELGEGYAFIDSEYKIKIGNKYNYIDILLFNYLFNSFVVVELKVTELRKEYIGQVEVYINYVDKNIKKINQDKTIGIIICKKDNKYIIEYSSDKRIVSRYYELI